MSSRKSPEAIAEEADRRRIYIESGLSIDDPTVTPNLLSRVSRDMSPKTAVDYNTRVPLGRKVDCAACGHSRNHFKGFLITFEDDSKAMVGIECGERDFFEAGAWGRLRSTLDRQKKAALFAARQAPVLRNLEAVRDLIVAWRQAASPLGHFINEFIEQFPDLASELFASHRTGGKLTRTVMRRVPIANSRGEISERLQPTEETMVVLSCPEAFSRSFPDYKLGRVVSTLSEAIATIGTDGGPQLQLERCYLSLRNLRADVVTLHALYDQARKLTDLALWDDIAKWGRANPNRVGNYRRRGLGFIHSDQEYEYGRVQLLQPNDVPLVPIQPIMQQWPTL